MKEAALYYLNLLKTDWAFRKLISYLRILLEEERKKENAP